MIPLTLSFRGLSHSPALEALVRTQTKALERLFPRILSCRVVIERLQKHQRAGAPFHVRIDVHVPGREIVTEHQPTLHAELQRGEIDQFSKATQVDAPLADARLAIRQAFRTARRQIEDDVTRQEDAHRRIAR